MIQLQDIDIILPIFPLEERTGMPEGCLVTLQCAGSVLPPNKGGHLVVVLPKDFHEHVPMFPDLPSLHYGLYVPGGHLFVPFDQLPPYLIYFSLQDIKIAIIFFFPLFKHSTCPFNSFG